MAPLMLMGGNCFQIASVALNDWSQGMRIMQLNGLTDPFLPTGVVTTLQIPEPEAVPSGGVIAQ